MIKKTTNCHPREDGDPLLAVDSLLREDDGEREESGFKHFCNTLEVGNML